MVSEKLIFRKGQPVEVYFITEIIIPFEVLLVDVVVILFLYKHTVDKQIY